MKRLYSILAVGVLAGLALGVLGGVRGRAAEAGFRWPVLFTESFSSRPAPVLNPAFAVFVVNSTGDLPDSSIGDGVCSTGALVAVPPVLECTLRAAIQESNFAANADTINFTIVTATDAGCVVGTGVCTISPGSALPTITQPVTIDGYTQPTSNQNTLAVGSDANIKIELNGTSAGAGVDGLSVTAGSSTIRGLAIYKFGGDGIQLATSGGNTITGNYLGTNATGAGTTNGNTQDGVFISNSGANTIGGSTPPVRNVISANKLGGVEISGASATGNFVQGNYIGTDRQGTLDVGNAVDGVYVGGPSNTIGGSTGTPGQSTGNVISGNGPGSSTGSGVRIVADTNTVAGNLIGLAVGGTVALGNSNNGVYITTAANNTIGGANTNLRNVISSNNGAGVAINGAGSTSNLVQGNYIGTDVTGALDRGNTTDGVLIDGGANNNTVGGSAATPGTPPGNVISGNNSDGIEINGTGTTGNLVQGNYIGINALGTLDLGNNLDGVFITLGATANAVGGLTASPGTPGTAPGNVISGNDSDGIEISTGTASPTNNTVQGNLIGTTASGTVLARNTNDGVRIIDSANNLIGGSTETARNVITGGTSGSSDGVDIQGANSSGNTVSGNYIGTDINGTADFGAGNDGVRITVSADNTTIGGSTLTPGAPPGNVISGHTGDGVEISGGAVAGNLVQGNLIGLQANGTTALANGANGVLISTTGISPSTIGGATAGLGNTIAFNGADGVFVSTGVSNGIRRNSIHSNNGLGIDLGPDGVTANDLKDPDTGANNLQNFPIITSANSTTQTIIGRLNSIVGQTFTIDFYKNTTCDGTNGEGRTYLGSVVTGTTDANGDVTFTFNSPVAFDTAEVVTATATDSANNTSEFSQCATATLIRLRGFSATSYADGVELNWDSGFEVNNLGYHLYREQNGKRTRVTPSIVAGSALTVGPGSRLTAGYSYSWLDPEGTLDSVYQIEAIDLDGSSQWAGRINSYAAPNGGGTRKAPRHERAMLLSEIGADSRDQSSVRSWPCLECSGLMSGSSLARNTLSGDTTTNSKLSRQKSGVEPSHSKDTSDSAELVVQRAIAAGKAVKIGVRQNGWYRVTHSELVAAGFDPSTDARTLQLYLDGEEVPIGLSSEGARLGSRDTLEFYGVGLDTPTTDTQVYWLVSGSSAGKRMIARRSKLKSADPNSEIVSGSFELTTERRDRIVYFSSLLNGDAGNVFGASVRTDPVSQTIVLKNLDSDSGLQPHIEVAMQGLTAQPHAVQVQVNGTVVGAMTFAYTEHSVAKFSINTALLREGDNLVTLASTNGQSDVSLIDWVHLTYPHQYKAENNSLAFSALSGQQVKLKGFATANVRVVDVTDPKAPMQVSALANNSGNEYVLTVQPTGLGRRSLIAFADDLAGHPASITANEPSTWDSVTNGADMVIIAHKEFRAAVEPLASLRRSQGLSVAVVDVEDVYDEFSYGIHTPDALKDFLKSAAANWTRKPRYLLLVGDSSWDPRNYFNKGENDFVPMKLIDTQGMETGSDDWVVDFNDVGVANMSVGRLPVRTSAEATLLVSKILAYEQERELNAPLRGAVMVADQTFESQSSQTRALLPANVAVQTINRADVNNDDMMRGQIVDALNQGPMLVNYYGHGSVRVWTGAGLLNSDLAGGLTNGSRLSVYVMMTCLNGYANDANTDSLGEAVLKAPLGGAVAVWASSGFTTPQPQFEMNSEFYRLLFGGQPMRLGDATRNAKAATSDMDVRRTWILLGDPAMRVR